MYKQDCNKIEMKKQRKLDTKTFLKKKYKNEKNQSASFQHIL